MEKPGFDPDAETISAIPLVRAIAHRICKKLEPLFEEEELAGAGMLGLVKAAASFDAAVHPPFAIYVRQRIRWEILDSIKNEAWSWATSRNPIESIAGRGEQKLMNTGGHELGLLPGTSTLTAAEKRLLELIYVEEMSCRQIGKQKVMDIGEKRAQKIHSKALGKLRGELDKAA